MTRLLSQVLQKNGLPGAICSLVTGGPEIGQALAECRDIDLISFTGSTKVGRSVGEIVQRRFGKTILELGGNNAVIGI